MKSVITSAAISALVLVLIVPIHALAVSENDRNPAQIQTGANQRFTPNAGDQMVVTAAPSDAKVRPGQSISLDISAHRLNGSAIDNATMKAWIINYINNTNKANMSGNTDKKGETTLKFKIAKDAKTSQWLINVQGNKAGFRQADISTGFAVTDFSGHDSSNGDKKKCSGSDCK